MEFLVPLHFHLLMLHVNFLLSFEQKDELLLLERCFYFHGHMAAIFNASFCSEQHNLPKNVSCLKHFPKDFHFPCIGAEMPKLAAI